MYLLLQWYDVIKVFEVKHPLHLPLGAHGLSLERFCVSGSRPIC